MSQIVPPNRGSPSASGASTATEAPYDGHSSLATLKHSMNCSHSIRKAAVAATVLVTTMAAHAGFDGATFGGYYAFPTAGTQYAGASAAPGSFVVGAGVESVVSVEGVTTISVDFSDSSLELRLGTVLTNPTWGTASFNGLVFDLQAGGPFGFTSATIGSGTTMAGFDVSRVGINAGQITIDWNGLAYADGTRVVIDFATPVPEPETYMLLIAGLGAVAVARRRRASIGAKQAQ